MPFTRKSKRNVKKRMALPYYKGARKSKSDVYIWYQLVDQNGLNCKGIDARWVKSDQSSVVSQFLQAVLDNLKDSDIFQGVTYSSLTVYKNMETFQNRMNDVAPLKHDSSVKDFGKSEKDPLVIILPCASPDVSKGNVLILAGMEVIQGIGSAVFPFIRSLLGRPIVYLSNLFIPARPLWKQELPRTYALSGGKMFFVNRAAAIKQLQEIHQSKFFRACDGSGPEWIIPIADNVLGLGKSEFGLHYIDKSRELWKDTPKNKFQKTLCDCHTVCIEFTIGALVRGDSFDTIMLDLLCRALRPMFDNPPAVLSNPPNTVERFLSELTESCGPIFIVLDEIGNAFYDEQLNDLDQREKFMQFCLQILDAWFSKQNVFFLLVGRGSFLSYVGLRPNNTKLIPTLYQFRRLNIHLLGTEAIKLIIENTLFDETSRRTLQDHFEIDNKLMDEVANHLYHATNGHARSLFTAFISSKSLSELLEYNQPLEIVNWEPFYDHIFAYKSVVSRLVWHLRNKEYVDLTQLSGRDKGLSWDIIATKSFISWEGTVNRAQLYTHPFLKSILEGIFLPLQKA